MAREMKGIGSSSFTIPAMIIGTEHAIVTMMADMTLKIRTIAASNLDINNLFKKVERMSTVIQAITY